MTDSTPTPQLYTLAADEKATPIMVYLPDGMARGELVSKQMLRVSTWLRSTLGISYITLYKAQALMSGGVAPQTLNFTEMHIPISQIIAYHILPPAQEPLDYDLTEPNRKMEPVTAVFGPFRVLAKARVSKNTNLGTQLRTTKEIFISLYDAEITNSSIPNMVPIRAPMMLVQPTMALLAIRA
jgi:hypothetical protein